MSDKQIDSYPVIPTLKKILGFDGAQTGLAEITTSSTDTTAGRVATTDSAVMNGDYPSDDAWTEVTSLDNGWTGTVYYIKRAGWVTVVLGDLAGLDASGATSIVIIVLPEAYRSDVVQSGVAIDASRAPNEVGKLSVDTFGNVLIGDLDGTVINGQITYPVL